MTVRVGVVGTGWGARVQIPCFRSAGLEVSALWAHSEDKARELGIELGVPFATTDFEELLAHAEMQLVSLTTPPAEHLPMAKAAIEAGFDVLCEKPTALDAAEAEAMVAIAAQHPDRLALIDHELRFLPSLQEARRLVREGYLGELFHARAVFLDAGRLDPEEPWNWWSDAEQGGGLMGAIGSHLLDLLAWVSGRQVESVIADQRPGARVRQVPGDAGEREVTADDYSAMLLSLEGGARGVVELSTLAAGRSELALELYGSAGSLVWSDHRLVGARAEGSCEELAIDPLIELPEGLRERAWERATLVFARELRKALEQRESSSFEMASLEQAARFADGLETQCILDAARRSVASGCRESVVRP